MSFEIQGGLPPSSTSHFKEGTDNSFWRERGFAKALASSPSFHRLCRCLESVVGPNETHPVAIRAATLVMNLLVLKISSYSYNLRKLFDFINRGETKRAVEIIEQLPSEWLRVENSDGFPPLILASKKDNTRVVLSLIKKLPEDRISSEILKIALSTAIQKSETEVAIDLVNYLPLDIEVFNSFISFASTGINSNIHILIALLKRSRENFQEPLFKGSNKFRPKYLLSYTWLHGLALSVSKSCDRWSQFINDGGVECIDLLLLTTDKFFINLKATEFCPEELQGATAGEIIHARLSKLGLEKTESAQMIINKLSFSNSVKAKAMAMKLLTAIEKGQTKRAVKIIEQLPSEWLRVENSDGLTPLILASKKDNTTVVLSLIKKLPEDRISSEILKINLLTAIQKNETEAAIDLVNYLPLDIEVFNYFISFASNGINPNIPILTALLKRSRENFQDSLFKGSNEIRPKYFLGHTWLHGLALSVSKSCDSWNQFLSDGGIDCIDLLLITVDQGFIDLKATEFCPEELQGATAGEIIHARLSKLGLEKTKSAQMIINRLSFVDRVKEGT